VTATADGAPGQQGTDSAAESGAAAGRMDAEYVVRLEVFEGPLDLLLTLVRRESLDITAVALSRVTDGYIEYLSALTEIDPGAVAEFCEVAATLLLIKSRALLPGADDDESEEDADARELVDKLRAYRAYRETAEKLAWREREGLHAYPRAAAPPDVEVQLQPGEASPDELAAAFERALAEAAKRVEPEPAGRVRPHRVRLSERLSDIRAMLAVRKRVRFHEVLLGESPSREFVIVSFMAVLELLRRGVVRAVQAELFGEIELELRPDAPARVLATDGEEETDEAGETGEAMSALPE